jgi:hypothetical protein
MKVSSRVPYRIASVLLLLFALGHSLGFRQTDPHWGVDSVVASMRTVRFDVQGFSRTYWDFFVGAGFFVSVFLLFAAVLAWQLGGLGNTGAHAPDHLDPAGAFCWRYDFELDVLVHRASGFLRCD